MDRFQNRAMCYVPNQNNQNFKNNLNNEFNIEIKQEIPDIDFEEEKIDDNIEYNDGYHSKCGEIYINNINKEFSLYCSLCNANFINFNLFSQHILYGNHGTQLFFLNNNNFNNTNINNNQQTFRLCNEKQIKSVNNCFKTNFNDIQPLSTYPENSSTSFLGIEDVRSVRDFIHPTEYKDEIRGRSLSSYNCDSCLRNFKSYRDLKYHNQLCHVEKKITSVEQPHLDFYKPRQHSLENIPSVATFSLAVCSTPTSNNEPNSRRTRSFSHEKYESGKTRSVTEAPYGKCVSNKEFPKSSSLTSPVKIGPQYALKSTALNAKLTTKGLYSSSSKYTGTTIIHGIPKVTGSVIKASATIAEISGPDNGEDLDSISASDQMSGNCPYCPVKFQKMKYINFHIQKYHPEKIQKNEIKITETASCYRCEICNMIFRRYDFFKKHLRKHPRNKSKFSNENITPKITIIPKIENIFEEETVKNNEYLNNLDKNISDNLNSRFSNLKNEIKETNILEYKNPKTKSRKRLKCQYCGKTCLKLNHLILHERKHKATNAVQCRVCDQRFYLKDLYENHMKNIHPEIEFKLNDEEIKKLTLDKNDVTSLLSETDIKDSINIKKKSCSFCPKVFKTVEYRILHEKAHTGTGNFACKYCDQKFNSIGTLWSHQKNCLRKQEENNIEIRETRLRSEKKEKEKLEERKTQEDPQLTEFMKFDCEKNIYNLSYNCTYCEKRFNKKYDLVDHVRKHTREKFECNLCDYKTNNSISLNTHILNLHDDKNTKNLTQETHFENFVKLDPEKETATTSLIKCDSLLQSSVQQDLIPSQEKIDSLKRYKCKFCQELYDKKIELESHLKTHLKSKQISCYDSYKCKYCNLHYKVKYQAALHERKHTQLKLFKCEICEKSFTSNGFLNFHKKIKHNIGKPITFKYSIKCQFCDKVFKQLKNLREHINLIHITFNTKEFLCKICEKQFISVEFLKSHLFSKHKLRNIKMINKELLHRNLIPKTVATDKELGKNSDEIEGSWTKKEKCRICKETVYYHNLATHMKTHMSSDKSFRCEICKRRFGVMSNLLRHKSMAHSTEKSKCKNESLEEISQQSAISNESISSPKGTSISANKPKKVTIRTLIKEKKIPSVHGPPFKCPHESCYKIFRRRTGFNKHYLLHLDTFKCQFCNRCFQTTEILQKHIKFHIEKLPFKCKLCSKTFSVKHALVWHKRRNNCGNPSVDESNISYNCEKCCKSFLSKLSLSQHILDNSCKQSDKEIQENSALKIKSNIGDDTNVNDVKPKCDTCGKNFLSPAYLAMHFKKTNCVSKTSKLFDFEKDSNSKEIDIFSKNITKSITENFALNDNLNLKYKCKICSKSFETKIMLYWHTRRRACEVPSEFTCESEIEDQTEVDNNVSEEVKDNIKIEKTENKETEHYEGEELKNEASLFRDKFDNVREQYQCEVCLKIFVVKGFLLRHMKYYHPPLIEKDIKKEKTDHHALINDKESDKTENECVIDPEENSNRRSTRKKVENEDIKNQCQICLKKFETKGLLAGHTRTKACFKSSSCMSTLRAQKTSTKEGTESMYKCNSCNKLFANEGFLTNHKQNQVCQIKKDNIIQNISQNETNIVELSQNLNKNLNQTNIEAEKQVNPNLNKEEKCENDIENKVNLDKTNNIINNLEIKKHFTCKRCNKIFFTKVALAWHTRRKECIYKRKKYKVKSTFSLKQQASKIRKKLVDGIINSRKVNTEHMKLQKRVNKASMQVFKQNKSVEEMSRKYQISKTIIYRKVNILKQIDDSIIDIKEETNMKCTKVKENDEKIEEVLPEMNIKQEIIEDSSKIKPKIDLLVLRKEKDKNMVRAIRNYIRDRKKGRKLPQRFYCDRYEIRKIHFYRKLFKLGLVRKKGPNKKDPENLSTGQDQISVNNMLKNDSENQIPANQNNTSTFIEGELKGNQTFREQIQKRRKGRAPKCSEEIVRKAVMDYLMGKGTQLQLCEKYNVGICAFHRLKKTINTEKPDLKCPAEKNEEIFIEKCIENVKIPEKIPVSNQNNLKSESLSNNILESKNLKNLVESEKILDTQICKEFRMHKLKRNIKMMKTGDIKKRRLAVMEACGDLIVNRKSKYNIPGTKENTMLMDAISDVVNGVRAFSNAVKHYKISFYTLKRYLRKYKEKILSKKHGILQKKDNTSKISISCNNETNVPGTDKTKENIELVDKNILKNISSSSLSSIENSSESATESICKSNIKLSNTNDLNIIKNISRTSNTQGRTVFDPATGQYTFKKKFEGRGGRGKMRQTVYSKPGTKENKILMEAIGEIRNKGRSIGHVSRKFQISIQTVSKYIKIFEKQGVISKFAGTKADRKKLGRKRITFSEAIELNSETQENNSCKNSIKLEIVKDELNYITSHEDNGETQPSNLPITQKIITESKTNFVETLNDSRSLSETSLRDNKTDINITSLKDEMNENGNKHESCKQNILKENSNKKEIENIKDLIRKPNYITQKIGNNQNPTSDDNKTKQIGQTVKQSENIQKGSKLIKSNIEIRKPTYLTQKSSMTVIKPIDVKQTETELDNLILEKKSKLINFPTSLISNQSPSTSANAFNFIQSHSKSQKSYTESLISVKKNELHKDIEINEKPSTSSSTVDQNTLEQNIDKIKTSTIDDLINKTKINIPTVQQETSQNIKFRKPIYITQKTFPLKTVTDTNFKSKTIDNSFKKSLSNYQASSTSTNLSPIHQLISEQKTNTIKPPLSTTIKLENEDIVNNVIQLRDHTITEFLNVNPNDIRIQSEINEEDLIIEHAMRSLLEQDTELDLGNVVESLTPPNKNEISTEKLSNTEFVSSKNSNNSGINLESCTKTLTTAFNILSDSQNCTDYDDVQFFD